MEFSPNAIGIELDSTVVSVSPKYFRPTEVDLLIGNPTKAKACPDAFYRGKIRMGSKTDLNKLVKIIVESDFKKILERGY